MTSTRVRAAVVLATPLIVAGLSVSGCTGGSKASAGSQSAGSAAEATAVAGELARGPAGGSGSNPACGYYSSAEISAVVGAPVGGGQDAALGAGCQWTDGSNADVSVMVVVVPPDYYEAPSLVDGFEEIAGIGATAFVVPQTGGFRAGASLPDKAVYADMSGGKSSKQAAIDLLRETIKRAG